jgi:GAF domain-containing protein
MTRQLRILFLEDRPADFELELHELQKDGAEIAAVRVETESEYSRQLKEFSPDLIIADYAMPTYDGFSALELAQKLSPDVPFIFISGTAGEDVAIDALKRGAADYLLKSHLLRLGSAVPRAIHEAEEKKKLREAEARIRHLNQLLLAIRDISGLMVKQRDPRKLMKDACKILVRTRGYLLVWIGATKPGSMQVVPVERAGPEADYVDEITVTWDESPTGLGPVGTSIRKREARVINDVATDPSFAPWREPALARGYGSVASFPLARGSSLFGALAVYADRPRAFDPEEIGLLNELAADLAFALDSIEGEIQQKRAEESLLAHTRALLESEMRYRDLFENANDVIYTIDLAGNITSLNKAGERI